MSMQALIAMHSFGIFRMPQRYLNMVSISKRADFCKYLHARGFLFAVSLYSYMPIYLNHMNGQLLEIYWRNPYKMLFDELLF